VTCIESQIKVRPAIVVEHMYHIPAVGVIQLDGLLIINHHNPSTLRSVRPSQSYPSASFVGIPYSSVVPNALGDLINHPGRQSRD